MILVKLIYVLFVITCLLGVASAEISLQMRLYNSDDDLSVGLSGENLEFNAMAALMPDSLLYMNGGESNQPECSYSYSVTLNGESLESGVSTKSGAFSWHTLVDSNSDGAGSKSFSLGIKNMVQNEILEAYQRTPDTEVDEIVYANNGIYSNTGYLTPDTLTLSGNGATTVSSNTNSQSTNEEALKGVVEVMKVSGVEKTATLVTNVLGNTDAMWRDRVSSSSSECKVGQAIIGQAYSSMMNLEMIGEATGFPTQQLPPGNININVNEPIYSSPQQEEIYKHYAEEVSGFRERFPQSSPALFYYLDERACIPTTTGDPVALPSLSGEIYRMNMEFIMRKR